VWRVEYAPGGRLTVRLRDHVSPMQLRDVAEAHARALEATGGEHFKVLLDLRGLFPLEADAVSLLGEIKAIAAELGTCRGLVILVDSPTVALQQRRSRLLDEHFEHEIVQDEAEAERKLSLR
jgi:hypothetical protein